MEHETDPGDWPDLAAAVARIVVDARWRGDHPDVAGGSLRHHEADAARSLAVSLSPSGATEWTPALALALATHPDVALAPRRDRPDVSLWQYRHAITYKAVRLGHALANGDARGTSRAEAAWLADEAAKRDDRDGRIVLEAARRILAVPLPAADPSRPVPFRLAWRGHRPRSRVTQAVYLSTGAVTVREVASGTAPVVASLSSPFGAPLEVRRIDGVLFRPVLAPGRWEPVTLDEFAASAEAGVAWTDSPFAPPDGDEVVRMGVTDHAGTPPARGLPSDVEAERLARETAVARAGTLVAIDGVVHRSTEPPEVEVLIVDRAVVGEDGVERNGEAFTVSFGWRFPDGLRTHADQATLVRRPDFRSPRDYMRAGPRKGDEGPIEGTMRFPLGEADEVGRMVGLWLTDHSKLWADWRIEPGSNVEVLDPTAFPPDPEAPFRDLLAWERLYAARGSQDVAAALRDARAGAELELPADPCAMEYDGNERDCAGLLGLLADRVREALAEQEPEDLAGMSI